MKYRLSLLFFLVALSGCDSAPPETQGKLRTPTPAVVEATSAQLRPVALVIERNGTLQPLRSTALSLQQEGVLLELPALQFSSRNIA